MFEVDSDISVKENLMESFLIQQRSKYHFGLKIRKGYKTMMVESGYLEMKYDIPNRNHMNKCSQGGTVSSEGMWSSSVWQWF